MRLHHALYSTGRGFYREELITKPVPQLNQQKVQKATSQTLAERETKSPGRERFPRFAIKVNGQ